MLISRLRDASITYCLHEIRKHKAFLRSRKNLRFREKLNSMNEIGYLSLTMALLGVEDVEYRSPSKIIAKGDGFYVEI